MPAIASRLFLFLGWLPPLFGAWWAGWSGLGWGLALTSLGLAVWFWWKARGFLGYDPELIAQQTLILDSLRAGAFLMNSSGKIIWTNQPAFRLLGYPRARLLGKEMADLVPTQGNWPDQWWNNPDFELAHPQFEAYLQTAKGQWLMASCTVKSLQNSQGQFQGMLLIARDISKEYDLRHFAKMVQQAPLSIVLTDPLGRITYANSTYLLKNQYALAEVLGKPMDLISHGFSENAILEDLKAKLKFGKTWVQEVRNQDRFGKPFMELVMATSLRNSNGDTEALGFILEDIDQRKRIEKALMEANQALEDRVEARVRELKEAQATLQAAFEELKSLEDLKEQFVSNVSHELRTPLSAILGFAEALYDCPMDTERNQQFLKIIISESNRLRELINDILDITALAANKKEFNFEPLDLHQEILYSISVVDSLLTEKKISIEYEPEDMKITFEGDRNRFLQVMVNLLGNAIKFSPESGIVQIKVTPFAEDFQVEVRDQGPGVPPEKVQVIFERFKQHQTESNKNQGTGLGLAISRKIIETHQGNIWAEARPNQGYFAFRLPYRRTR